MRRISLLASVLLAGLVLTACGGDSTGANSAGSTPANSASASPAADHNQADVTFAQMMIPHHQQAIEMARLAATRAQSPEVKTLATQIENAQAPEIQTMTQWLTAWGQSPTAPMPGMSGMPGMSASAAPMPGMPGMSGMGMTPAEMQQLTAASGAKFDRMFLTMMTAHHKSAIAMAQEEQRSGQFAPAKEMANSIVTTQQAEIAQMAGLLKTV